MTGHIPIPITGPLILSSLELAFTEVGHRHMIARTVKNMIDREEYAVIRLRARLWFWRRRICAWNDICGEIWYLFGQHEHYIYTVHDVSSQDWTRCTQDMRVVMNDVSRVVAVLQMQLVFRVIIIFIHDNNQTRLTKEFGCVHEARTIGRTYVQRCMIGSNWSLRSLGCWTASDKVTYLSLSAGERSRWI